MKKLIFMSLIISLFFFQHCKNAPTTPEIHNMYVFRWLNYESCFPEEWSRGQCDRRWKRSRCEQKRRDSVVDSIDDISIVWRESLAFFQ